MSLINTILQASSVFMNSQNSQWQRERENERGLTALEIEGIRQEHQLKMTYLQQELQQKAREFDRIHQSEQRGTELINQAHLDGAKIHDSERYIRGTWKEAHFGNEQPPYVVFCINPLQDLNQFKDELARIAPFQRTYDNFKTRNAAYVGRLFSTITISETFKSEAEARSFFYRELNCPCIIVYGIFTGTGFGVYALSAGMSPEQLRIDGQKVADWGIRIEKLWDISYNTIHAIKQRATDDAIKQLKKKAAEMGFTLPTDPELLRQKAVELRGRFDVLEGLELYTDTHAGLCVQVMLDNYFSYFPRQVYDVKTPDFLEAKQKELTRLGIWEALKTSLLERYEVLKGRQKVQFLAPKNIESELEIDLENDYSEIEDKAFCEVDYKTLKESMYGYEWQIKDKEGNWRKIFTFSPRQVHFELLSYMNPDYYWPTSTLYKCVDGEYQYGADEPYVYEWPNFVEGLCCIIKGGKYGLINSNGTEIIPCEWDLVEIGDGFVVATNLAPHGSYDSSCLFNTNGNQILPKNNTNYDMLTLPSNGLLGSQNWDFHNGKVSNIIDLEGNIVFKSGYAVEFVIDNTYIVHSTDSVFLIDRKGKILKSGIEIKYLGDVPEPFFLIRDKNHKCYLYSLQKNKSKSLAELFPLSNLNKSFNLNDIIVRFEHSQNLGEGYYGICMTYKGILQKLSNIEKIVKTLTKQELKFDELDKIVEFSLFLVFSFTDNKYFTINNIDKRFFRKNPYLCFSEGKIVFEAEFNSNKWYFVNKSTIEEDFDPKKNKTYDSATPYSEGLAAVKEGKFWGYIDHDERVKIPFIYEDARPFSEGMATVKKNGKYGAIDKNCKTVIPFIFENISFFKKGYNCVCLNKGHIRQHKGQSVIEHPKWAIINNEGKILVM